MVARRIERFEDLHAWIKARELVREVYAISLAGDLAMRDQLRRAAVSIAANIAEGFERDGDREFLQALSCAKGSAGEVRSLLTLALDLNYVDPSRYGTARGLAEEASRLIAGLMRYLKASEFRGKKFK